LVEPERTNLVQYPADPRVVLDDRVSIFALRERLMLEFGGGHVRLMRLHEVDAHEERLGRSRDASEIVERSLFNITVVKGNPNGTCGAVDDRRINVLTVDLEFLFCRLPGIARHRTLGHALKHGP